MTSSALQDIIAVFGCPAAGNPAQYLFERAIEAAGLDVRFLTVDVSPDRLAAALAGAEAMGFRGCLLSGPLRETAVPLVANPSPASAFAGAVTLVERQSGPLVGHMTDGRGAVEALRHHADPAGSRAVILGAGSRGRATALELSLAGAARILVCDPDAQRAAALVDALAALGTAAAEQIDWQATVELPADVDIVVAALPQAGGRDGPQVVGLRGDLVVADFTLAAQPGPLGRQAVAVGACLVDGIEIHAARTSIDFHALTGGEADAEMLRDTLDEFLAA